jgi:putative transposase
MFRAMIEYKCKLYGKQVFVVDRYYPSSQLCSDCGSIHKMDDETYRLYECPSCGMVMDRDLNAAINIKRAGTAPNNACGEHNSNKRSLLDNAGSHVL